MRRPVKSVLATVLKDLIPEEVDVPETCEFVIDGGHRLHRVGWPRPVTYGEIIDNYAGYVENNYGTNSTVVFDGYDGPATTKSQEQQRRSAKACSTEILFESDMHATTSQTDFLANSKNKSRLIHAVSFSLSSAQITVIEATADADKPIVATALDLSCTGHTIETIDIKQLQNALGELKDNLLLLHAISGCDTTYAPFGKGKKTAFRLLRTTNQLRKEMQIFNDPQASHQMVAQAGERFFLCLYGGHKCKTIDQLRYNNYKKTIAQQSLKMSFKLASLPPTSAATKQHSFRTYLQIQAWLGNELVATEWGWKSENGKLIPVPTDLPPAPDKILNMISCNCKNGCQCGCRKLGVPCSTMCKECTGVDCLYAAPTEQD